MQSGNGMTMQEAEQEIKCTAATTSYSTPLRWKM